MKKKIFVIIGITLPIFLILYFWYNDCWTAMKINWKISMPYMSLYREIYHKDSGPSFFGDGTRYHVYSYKNEKHIEKMVEWQTEEKETEIRSSYSEFIREELQEIVEELYKKSDRKVISTNGFFTDRIIAMAKMAVEN